MPITLIRHTQPDIKKGICYGRSNIDVASNFKEMADAVADQLQPQFKLISSNLIRCQKLAHHIGNIFNTDVTIDDRFQEMDFGNWENTPWSEISRTEIDAWANDFLHARPHGGESVYQLRNRIRTALADYTSSPEPIVIITHAGVIKAALSTGDTAEHFQSNIGFGEIIAFEP